MVDFGMHSWLSMLCSELEIGTKISVNGHYSPSLNLLGLIAIEIVVVLSVEFYLRKDWHIHFDSS